MALFEEEQSLNGEKWSLLFDGASNVFAYGIGAMLISPENQVIPFTSRLTFDCTNNMAEYEACAMGVLATLEEGRLETQS